MCPVSGLGQTTERHLVEKWNGESFFFPPSRVIEEKTARSGTIMLPALEDTGPIDSKWPSRSGAARGERVT
jgi:hypothetical protein